jgi:hypothetical protein
MAPKLRNVTVTLEEEVVRWARVYAARRDASLSRVLADMIRERMARERMAEDTYESAMRRALSRKPFLKSSRRHPSRQELHDRRLR